jgi:hypothetical protein
MPEAWRTRHNTLKFSLVLPVTEYEITHSVPISETESRKIAFSANMTPCVTQKRGIFVTNSAKTALASYLLLTKTENVLNYERKR